MIWSSARREVTVNKFLNFFFFYLTFCFTVNHNTADTQCGNFRAFKNCCCTAQKIHKVPGAGKIVKRKTLHTGKHNYYYIIDNYIFSQIF